MPVINSVIIYDHGDPSVGIQGCQWAIEYPGGIEIEDDEIENFRKDLSEMHVWCAGEKGIVEFDFETAKRMEGESALDRMLDEASDTGDEMRKQGHDWGKEGSCNCFECERLNGIVDSIFRE